MRGVASVTAARRRDIGVIMVTELDSLARSLHQLVANGRELEALGVDLVVVDQAIDTSSKCRMSAMAEK